MNDGTHYAEYAVYKKAQGQNLIIRILFILLYIAIPCSIFINMEAAAAIGAIAVVLDCIVIFITKSIYMYSFETVINSSVVTVSKLTSKKTGKKKTIFEEKVKDLEAIAPYTEENKAKITDIEETLDCRGDNKSGDTYYLIGTKDGKKVLVLIEITNKMMDIFSYYNKATVKCDWLSK